MKVKVFLFRDDVEPSKTARSIRNIGDNSKLYMVNTDKYRIAMADASKALKTNNVGPVVTTTEVS